MKLIESLKTRWVVWVWNHTPTCAEMSRLSSERLDRPLGLLLRLKMRLHFVICAWCERYFKQLEMVHRRASGLGETLDASPLRGLSPEARQRIKDRLREHDHDHR